MALHLRGITLPGGQTEDLYVTDHCTITYAPIPAKTILERGYIVPGLVDSHAHLEMHSPAGDAASPEVRARASALAQLDAGVLALREPGGPTRVSRGLGPHEGLPRVITAGHLLAPPDRYVPGLARSVTEEELPAAAEEEAGLSGAWAKVIGDFPVSGGGVERHYTRNALADAVAKVHALGCRIALHAITRDVIEDGIAAGFDSIEHGTFMTPDHLGEMLRRNIAWVPTLIINQGIRGLAVEMGMPVAEREQLFVALDGQPEVVREAANRGVTVLAGTDAGMVPHGMVRVEMANLLAAGLTPERALGAASWAGRRFLGLPSLEEGARADVVAYADDPRGDAEVLSRPALRILDGELLA